MKKILSLLLVVIMSCSVFACGKKGSADSDISLGTVVGSSYSNDYFGISCEIPDGWVYYSDKQIMELNNITSEYLDEDVKEMMKNSQIFYDMFAVNESIGSSVSVNMEKVGSRLNGISLKEVAESQIDAIKASYKNMGYSNVSVKYQKYNVNGKEVDGLRITAEINDLTIYGAGIMYKKDGYIVNTSITTIGTDDIATVMSWIKLS